MAESSSPLRVEALLHQMLGTQDDWGSYSMEAFDLDQTLRDGYAGFSRSFSRIRAVDLQREIDLA